MTEQYEPRDRPTVRAKGEAAQVTGQQMSRSERENVACMLGASSSKWCQAGSAGGLMSGRQKSTTFGTEEAREYGFVGFPPLPCKDARNLCQARRTFACLMAHPGLAASDANIQHSQGEADRPILGVQTRPSMQFIGP